jgi:hypothetical protein
VFDRRIFVDNVVQTNVSHVFGLRFVLSVELPCTVLNIVKDAGNGVVAAYHALCRKDSSVERVKEFPIVQTAFTVVCGPEVFLYP